MSFLSCVLVNEVNTKLMERKSISTWMKAVNVQLLHGSILANSMSTSDLKLCFSKEQTQIV